MFTDSLFLSPILLVSRKRIIVSITLAFARIPIFQVANISLFTQASFFVLSMPCVQYVGHLTMHLTQMIVQFAGDVLAPSLCSFLLCGGVDATHYCLGNALDQYFLLI